MTLTEDAAESVGYFQTKTRAVVQKYPHLVYEKLEDFIDCAFAEVLIDYYDSDDEREVALKLFKYVMSEKVVQDIIVSVAKEPKFELQGADPHILFAHAWTAHAVMRSGGLLLLQKDAIDTLDTIIFTCCHILAKWPKYGYRLDWHFCVGSTHSLDPAAPVGSWTKEWLGCQQVSPPVKPIPIQAAKDRSTQEHRHLNIFERLTRIFGKKQRV